MTLMLRFNVSLIRITEGDCQIQFELNNKCEQIKDWTSC